MPPSSLVLNPADGQRSVPVCCTKHAAHWENVGGRGANLGAVQPSPSDDADTFERMEAPGMSDQATVTVRVETRDLDTDERVRSEFSVRPLDSDAADRASLIEVVARVQPDAKLRSFGNGAATFLGRQHLVIASFRESVRERRSRSRAAQSGEQDSLFAA